MSAKKAPEGRPPASDAKRAKRAEQARRPAAPGGGGAPAGAAGGCACAASARARPPRRKRCRRASCGEPAGLVMSQASCAAPAFVRASSERGPVPHGLRSRAAGAAAARRGPRERREVFHVEHFGVDNGVKWWYHRGAPTGGAPAPSDRGAASAAPLFLFVPGLPVPRLIVLRCCVLGPSPPRGALPPWGGRGVGSASPCCPRSGCGAALPCQTGRVSCLAPWGLDKTRRRAYNGGSRWHQE